MFGECQEGVVGGGGKIVQVWGVFVGYDQYVCWLQWKDVQQDDEMFVFEEFVCWFVVICYGVEYVIYGKF